MATNDNTGADAPTKPISELTDQELEQEFLKGFKNVIPANREAAKAIVLGMDASDRNNLSRDASRCLLSQRLVQQLEAMSPEELKEAKDFIWEFGSKLISEKEVGDE